jgi:hypothetical protein
LVVWLLRTRVRVIRAAHRGEPVPVEVTPHRWDLLDTGEFTIIRGIPTEKVRPVATERDKEK